LGPCHCHPRAPPLRIASDSGLVGLPVRARRLCMTRHARIWRGEVEALGEHLCGRSADRRTCDVTEGGGLRMRESGSRCRRLPSVVARPTHPQSSRLFLHAAAAAGCRRPTVRSGPLPGTVRPARRPMCFTRRRQCGVGSPPRLLADVRRICVSIGD